MKRLPFIDLLSLLSEIPDPRRRQGQRYSHVSVLLLSILSMVAGARSYRQSTASSRSIWRA